MKTVKKICDFVAARGMGEGEVVRNSPANAGGASSISGSGRSPGEGNSNPLKYSLLGNLMDRGAWHATVHGVAKSWTRLSMCAPRVNVSELWTLGDDKVQ